MCVQVCVDVCAELRDLWRYGQVWGLCVGVVCGYFWVRCGVTCGVHGCGGS